MKCKFCKREIDFLTVNDEPICTECAKQEKYIACAGCGRFFLEKYLNNNEGICPSCMEKE